MKNNSIIFRLSKSLSKILFLLLSVFSFYLIYDTYSSGIEERDIYVSSLSDTLTRMVSQPLSRGNYFDVEDIIQNLRYRDYIQKVEIVFYEETISKYDKGESNFVSEKSIGDYLLKIGWSINDLFWDIFTQILMLLLFIVALYIAVIQIVKYTIFYIFDELTTKFEIELNNGKNERIDLNNVPEELLPYIRKINESMTIIKEIEEEKVNIKVAKQVAHDIKSPLAALEIVMDDLKSLPEDTREITINAVNRIKGIANDLSKQKEKSLGSGSVYSRILISITLMNIVNEKIVENQNKHNVEIDLFDESKRDSFINIDEEVFLRIVSNLINNSIEAMEEDIQVRVSISEMNGFVTLTVEDNGRGFPDTFLDEGIERGKSVEKVGGQGLGLWYAKDEVERCGGDFFISNTDNGAKVEIKLKVVEAPKWFQGTVNLKNMKNVVIVDDDLSIHDLWKKKLKDMGLNIKNYQSVEEFEAGLVNHNETLYLLDFDLRNFLTGVDLIVKYKLTNSLLVTSNYDVLEVIRSCEQHDISILPKQLVPYVSTYS